MATEPAEVNFLLTMFEPVDGNLDALIVKAYNALAGEGMEPLALARLPTPPAFAHPRVPGAFGYSRVDDVVMATMTLHDWGELLLLLGMAGGVNPELRERAMVLVNHLNYGRPPEDWKPYATKPRASGGTEYP